MAQPDYSLPAWEQQSADPADFWLKGMQLGASVQHARNQLDLQAQTTALETSVKQEQAQKSMMLQQQELEQQQAYKQAQMGIQQQQLQQAQQEINLKTQAAGQAFIAQRAYQQTVQQLVDSGMSEEQASMTAMLRTAPLMKVGGAGVASLAKGLQQQTTGPKNYQPQPWTDTRTGRQWLYSAVTGKMEPASPNTPSGLGLDKMNLQNEQRINTEKRKALLSGAYGEYLASGKAPDDVAKLPQFQAAKAAYEAASKSSVPMAGAGDEWDAPYGAPTQAAPTTQTGTSPSNIKSIRPLGATTTAPTGTAATPTISIPTIPGLPQAKPLSDVEKKKSESFMAGYQESAAKSRTEYAAKIAQDRYELLRGEAENLYKGMKNYQANPAISYMKPETWQENYQKLSVMLSKLKPEDRKAITGEEEPSGYDTEGRDVPAQP